MKVSGVTIARGVQRFEGARDGSHVLIVFGLHPDETGQVAWPLEALVRQTLRSGSVTLAEAFPGALPSRGTGPNHEDANRSFRTSVLDAADPCSWTRRLQLLWRLAQDADVVVDLHRYSKRDGGIICFVSDDDGARFSIEAGFELVVSGLMQPMRGALTRRAANAGKQAFVVECGPIHRVSESDQSALVSASRILAALGKISPAAREYTGVHPELAWPTMSRHWRFHSFVDADSIVPDVATWIDRSPHMAPLPTSIGAQLRLPSSARLLMTNIRADPVAYACKPASS